jgi:hypothetical protein
MRRCISILLRPSCFPTPDGAAPSKESAVAADQRRGTPIEQEVLLIGVYPRSSAAK